MKQLPYRNMLAATWSNCWNTIAADVRYVNVGMCAKSYMTRTYIRMCKADGMTRLHGVGYVQYSRSYAGSGQWHARIHIPGIREGLFLEEESAAGLCQRAHPGRGPQSLATI